MTPQQRSNDPLRFHMGSVTVASCQNRRCKLTRRVLVGNPTFCSDCGHALYYERIEAAVKPSWIKGGLNARDYGP